MMIGVVQMSVWRYDKAIVENFREILNDDRIHIMPPENAIKFIAQLKKDDISFPLISIQRLGYSIINSRVNHSAKFIGGYHHNNGDNTNTFVQAIPIRIEYQIDVYTVDQQSCDEFCRELIFYLMQNPTLIVKYPYMVNGEHKFNLFLNDEIVDNSDTVNHINNGVLFRHTLTMYTDDANLFAGDIQKQGNVKAIVDSMDIQ